MDPTAPVAGVSPTPVFQGAESSSRDLRAAGDRLLNTLFPNTLISDPARREKLGKSAEHVVELTALLGLIQAALPGIVGRAFGIVASGLEKDPGTGKVRPGAGTAGNFLPSPLGFLDPTAIGLKPNFYLPAGSSQVIPPIADRLGLGIPQQRAEDEANASARADAEIVRRNAAALSAVQGESADTLRDLAAGRGGLTRSGVLFATSGVGFVDLQNAAIVELTRRENAPGLVASIVQPALMAVNALNPFTLDQTLPPVPTAPPGASELTPVPTVDNTQPVNDAAKRNERGKKGIDRELIHERADP